MPPILFLVDGHALAYRTYFALSRGAGFATRSGEQTAGVFGFTSVLLRILEQEQPDYLAVAFDTGRTFRDDIFPEYKGTREKMPDDLRPQIERMRQLVDAFNIPRLEIEGYEADDVLGSVARQAVERGLGVKIFTGDRDLLQLVNERVIVNLPGRSLSDSKDYLSEDVLATMGVRPDQVVDYKALVGDKSDNIPGVTGVGKKTAETLLKKYNTLDGVYANLEELSPNVRKKLETDKEAAYLSKELATIVKDLQIPLDLDQARPDAFDFNEVEALFRELEFRTLMRRLKALAQTYGMIPSQEAQQLNMFSERSEGVKVTSVKASTTEQYERELKTIVIDTPQTLRELGECLSAAPVIAFDTETTSTDQMRAELVGIALAVEPGCGYYIPVGHTENSSEQLSLEEVLNVLRAPLTDPKIPKAGHNLKYDYVLLARYGLKVSPLIFDTMIAEWLQDSSSRNLGLKNLAWVRQGIHMTPIDELIGSGRKQISMAEVPIERVAPYAAADAEVVLRLMPELREDLENCQALELFQTMEMPLIPVLADMEIEGIALDADYLQSMSQEIGEQLEDIQERIHDAVGKSINLNSPQQLSEALFDRLQLEPPDRTKRTASGFYSTSAGVLEAMRDQHEVVNWILEYRELSKLRSTYLDALPIQVNPQTMRVHTSFNQTGSRTGRIASSDPNLQNIPIRSEMGRRVRYAFVASPGNTLLAVDYSQIELRVVAHMADDQAMKSAFHAGQDIHAATAAAIYEVPLTSVTSEQRRRAKGINFGLIYGMSAFGLTRYTDLTLAESEEFMEAYFQRFPGVKSYLDGMRKLAAEQGYVETLLGRRRYFPELIGQANRNIRNRAEREAINAPIQGTAADIMKLAMLRVPEALQRADLTARMLLQVHDEIVLECPMEQLQASAQLVRNTMENVYPLSVPLLTEARHGENWGQMELIS